MNDVVSDAPVYDVIIVGGGLMGLSTAYHAAKRNLKTLLIEKQGLLGDSNSSIHNSRQFYLHHKQRHLSELAIAAEDYWAELQSYNSHDTLIKHNGSLWFGHKDMAVIDDAVEVMQQCSIPYKSYADAKHIEQRYPFSALPESCHGFSQANGGVIDIHATQKTLFNTALQSGFVDFIEWQDVIDIESVMTGGVHVYTQRTGEKKDDIVTHKGQKLVLTPSAYINDIVGHLGLSIPIKIGQITSAYFRRRDSRTHFPSWCAHQKNSDDTDATIHGYPESHRFFSGYVGITAGFPDRTPTDELRLNHQAPSLNSLDVLSEWVNDFIPSLDPTPHFTFTHLMAFSRDEEQTLYLDYMPDSIANAKNIICYAGSWADKFAPVLGDMICQMVEDEYITEFAVGESRISANHFDIAWEVAK